MGRPAPGPWFGLDQLWWIGTVVATVGLLLAAYAELSDRPRWGIGGLILLIAGAVVAVTRHVHSGGRD